MEERIQSFQDLNVWRKAHQLVLQVYKTTSDLPSNEQFTLGDQLKRSSTAVASNIAEGFQKRNKQEKIQLYQDAQSALNNLYYLLILTNDLNYADTAELSENAHEIQKMLGGLIRSVLGFSKSSYGNKTAAPDLDSDEVDLL